MCGDFPLLFLKDVSSLEGLCMPRLCSDLAYNCINQSSCVLVGQMALLCGTTLALFSVLHHSYRRLHIITWCMPLSMSQLASVIATSKLTSGTVSNSCSHSKFVIQLLPLCNRQLSLLYPFERPFSRVLFLFVFISWHSLDKRPTRAPVHPSRDLCSYLVM